MYLFLNIPIEKIKIDLVLQKKFKYRKSRKFYNFLKKYGFLNEYVNEEGVSASCWEECSITII
jgi:hypothetical protein